MRAKKYICSSEFHCHAGNQTLIATVEVKHLRNGEGSVEVAA
jgi:hypothetical protein